MSQEIAPEVVEEKRNSGQWIGRVESQTAVEGWAVVELDERARGSRGRAYQFPDDPSVPPVYVDLDLRRGIAGRHSVKNAKLSAFHPQTGQAVPHELIREFWPFAWASKAVDLEFDFNGDQLAFAFATHGDDYVPTGTDGTGLLRRVPNNAPAYPGQVMSWRQFTSFASRADDGVIFRGQPAKWRMRTSFHRSKRADFNRYWTEDVPEVHRILTCQLPHYFELGKLDHVAAFLSLIQHHGFPTPLLDWTFSPYVAAFFAFEKLALPESEHVRIFVFDRAAWISDVPQVGLPRFLAPHFSMMDVPSIGNNRLVPQQATAALTNIDDIESYIHFWEAVTGRLYLRRIDIPVAERDAALRHLRLMGITAGSLFPGLDGSCRALSYKNFGP